MTLINSSEIHQGKLPKAVVDRVVKEIRTLADSVESGDLLIKNYNYSGFDLNNIELGERTFSITTIKGSESYGSVEHAAENADPKLALEAKAKELLKNAARCFYNYDTETGSRPCTIDMERNYKKEFSTTSLPSCPFRDACFTRSDCVYITGTDISEAEGAAQVVRDLRQFNHSIDKLTKENTQSLRPYL